MWQLPPPHSGLLAGLLHRHVKSCLVVCQLKSATLVQTVVAMFSDYIEILLVKVNNSKLAQMCFWLA